MITRIFRALITLSLAVPLLAGCTVRYVVADRSQIPPHYENPGTPPEQPGTPPESEEAEPYDPSAVQTESSLTVVLGPNASPRDGYVWVEPFVLRGEVAVPGFWRLRLLPGFVWVDGSLRADLGYVPGYWSPVRHRGGGYEWVPGHWWGWRWIPGRWRERARTDYTWVPGHWTWDGDWVDGTWQPVGNGPSGMVWEPGYWGSNGLWIEGSWRPQVRLGFLWVPREWDGRNGWRRGYWKRCKTGETWLRGHWDNRGKWQGGKLTKLEPNRTLVPGHFNARNEWVEHHWREAAREQAAEEFKNFRDAREGVAPQPERTGSHLAEEREQAREEFQNFRDAREGAQPEPVKRIERHPNVRESEERVGITAPTHGDGGDEEYNEDQEQPQAPGRTKVRQPKHTPGDSAPGRVTSPGLKLGHEIGRRPNQTETREEAEPEEQPAEEQPVRKVRERKKLPADDEMNPAENAPEPERSPRKLREDRPAPENKNPQGAESEEKVRGPKDDNPGQGDFRKNRNR